MQVWGPAAVPVARRPALVRGPLISPLWIPAYELPLVVGILAFLLLWWTSPDTLQPSYLLLLCFSLAACSPSAARAADPQGFINFCLHLSLGEVPKNSSTLITPLCTCREGVIHSPKVYLLSLIYKLHLTWLCWLVHRVNYGHT